MWALSMWQSSRKEGKGQRNTTDKVLEERQERELVWVSDFGNREMVPPSGPRFSIVNLIIAPIYSELTMVRH